MHRPAYALLLPILIGCLMMIAGAAPAQDIASFRAARDAYIDNFRRTGQRPLEPALALEQEMLAALETAPAANRGALLFEIASMQRLQGRFEEAIATYQAALAEDASGEVAFGAWIGIARAHAYGTKDHGAADEALQHALEAAGPEPSRKHRYELADYLAQLQIARGEIEAALSNALEANRARGDRRRKVLRRARHWRRAAAVRCELRLPPARRCQDILG